MTIDYRGPEQRPRDEVRGWVVVVVLLSVIGSIAAVLVLLAMYPRVLRSLLP